MKLVIEVVSVVCAVAALLPSPSSAQTIKIGEINSYKTLPALMGPYRKGWELAQEEVNSSGGVLGRKLETVFRDDNANPGDAVRVAEELVSREQVQILSGVT